MKAFISWICTMISLVCTLLVMRHLGLNVDGFDVLILAMLMLILAHVLMIREKVEEK